MAPKRSFTPALFSFLRDLEANNDRAWFNANKQRYERAVRQPGLQFVDDFAPHLAKISPHFVADARASGGSMFRIYRDVRFTRDKSPYKINTGFQFRHEAGRDVHAPGFYLHLEPGAVFAGVGLWRPDAMSARSIREAIAEDPTRWKRVTRSKRFLDVYTLEGDSLKRPPRGFDPEHPVIDDLKRKDYIASTQLTQKAVTSEGFIDAYAKLCRTAAPFMEFLCDAVGVPF
ncbi:MAG: TIGR02453 family protein [Gammaproteobacteria bacterium]|nr:TIGR02453 family protein [Gammaproteobacteria bacterium]